MRSNNLPGATGQLSKFSSVNKDRSVDALRTSGVDSIDEDLNRDFDELESSIGMSGSLKKKGKEQIGLGRKFLQMKAAETVKAKKRYSEQTEQ
jgi:hypothetical protein